MLSAALRWAKSRPGGLSALVPVVLALAGCAPAVKPSHPPTLPTRSRITAGNYPPPNAADVTLAAVRAHPLYQQAEQACRDKHFDRAATLLARLETVPGLTPAQIRFVQDQRIVCLQDAHLPVPPALRTASLKSSSPSASSPLRSPAVVSPEQADCGPRALLLVCQRLNVVASLPQLRQRAGTTSKGTSMAGLVVAAKAAGLKAEGVQVSREALPDQEMPAVAYVNSNHFIAVLALQGSGESGTATIHDPNSAGEETIPQERLLRLCSGYLLLLRR